MRRVGSQVGASGLPSSTGWAGPERSDTLGEVRLIEGRLATAAKLTAAAYQSDADAAAADAAAVAVGGQEVGGHEKEADAGGAHLQRTGCPAGEGRSYKISGRGARVAVGGKWCWSVRGR